jgi:RHS repeat-associated protein
MPNLLFCLLFLFYQTADYRIDLGKYYGSQKQDKLNDYVEPDGAGNYRYVFQFKDIWNNVRLSYSDLNNNGSINPATEILHERNYYPFGMEHRGYNTALIGTKNNLKTFQGQEFTEDFGLHTHEWRYRISDPLTGRFWQIDPLAADYPYNSTFAFQENKLGMGVELEGAELFGWQDPVAAAKFSKGMLQAVKDEAVGLAQSTQYIGPSGAASAAFDFAPAANQLSNDFGGTVKAVVNNVIESLQTPEGQGYALGTLALTVLDPSPAGETSAALKTADKVADVASDVSKAASKADFVVTSNGIAIPIPDGAVGPTNPNKGSGMLYQGGSGGKGMSKKTTGVRIMDANGKQGRRVNYMNNAKPTPQTVDPVTGNPISNKDPRGHIPIPIDPNF